MSVLSHDEARRAYDRIGAWQDTQAFYEDRATEILLEHARIETAQQVLELGCGTGRFARRLLSEHLPANAQYRGLDLSPTMVHLARERVAQFGARAEIVLTDGSPPTGEPTASADRFVSNFVFDLLSEQEITAVVGEAHRILRPGGLLCVSSLSTGSDRLSRAVARVWLRVHALVPSLVGGCRPLDLLAFIAAPQWRVQHHEHVRAYGLPSEVVVAERV